MELGWSYPKRKEIIDRLLNSVTVDQNKFPIEFQNERKFFPIIKVDIGMPKYRLSNGRTQDLQEQYYTANNLSEDFFEIDLEREEAHKAQHEILKTQLNFRGLDLIDYFKKHEQTEPLILDNNGFVVNGNRRLCAMREIHQKNLEDKLPIKFSHIEVIILPPCSEEDILVLEGKLQITEDIKADYNWTAEGCMYRSLRDKRNYTTQKIGKIYNKKQEYIEDLLILLTYVDQYLESRDQAKQYHLIQDDTRYAFEAIVKARKKLDDEDKKDIFQTISFSVIDHRLPGMERIYRFIPRIAENIDAIIEKAKDEFPLDSTTTDNDSLDNGLLGGSYFEEDLINLAQTIDKVENRENVVQIAKDVIDSEEDRKQRFTVIEKIQRANTLLQDAINIFDDSTERDGIESQLETIKSHVLELEGKL